MKFGQAFEETSVPEWSINNINYDSLKRTIKVHTTKGQASAITIPGHQDSALERFENDLYLQLKFEHDRTGRFVALKATEIGWRLQKHSNDVQAFIVRCSRRGLTQKRLLRFAKLERALAECSDEIGALSRFVNAQKVAFRKLLKKYKKWTGSTSLSGRFKGQILSDPKSFTQRDFTQLQEQCRDLLSTLRGAIPEGSASTTPTTPTTPNEASTTPSRRNSRLAVRTRHNIAAPPNAYGQPGYWNEYDNGSEAGDVDGGYVVYVDPDESPLPSLKLPSWLVKPFGKAKALMSGGDGEDRSLLGDPGHPGYGAIEGASSNPPRGSRASTNGGHTTDTEGEDDAFASDLEFPPGYETYSAALPSVETQKMARSREKALFWSTIGGFSASIVLLGVVTILLVAGRRRLRVEVEAGATVGVIASLSCACAAVGASMVRRDPQGLANSLAVWVTFIVVCLLNGMLLIVIVGNAS